MPALYLFLKNGDSLLLGCSDTEGIAGYNAVMEDSAGYVDFNSGNQAFRLGVRAADVAAICYNPLDNDTVFASSAVAHLQRVNQEIEIGKAKVTGTVNQPKSDQ